MGYPDLFVNWIMRCVDTVAFLVSVNESWKVSSLVLGESGKAALCRRICLS